MRELNEIRTSRYERWLLTTLFMHCPGSGQPSEVDTTAVPPGQSTCPECGALVPVEGGELVEHGDT